MKKVLFVSHVANFQKFNRPYMNWFKEQGWCVHYASLDDETIIGADEFHKIDFRRNPFNIKNIKALFQLIKLYKREKYDIVHCHTPIGGILARTAAIFSPKTKVIYTAHGFHFYKGAPKKNYLIFHTAEKLFARRTDALVTINNEDYSAAQEFRLRKGGKAFHINGVGIDTAKIADAKALSRAEFDIPENAFIVLTVAELIRRKNYLTALRAFAAADIPNSYYIICGNVISDGDEEVVRIKELVKELGISDRVIFTGYRRDVFSIIKLSDVFLFTSTQEGLSIAVIEAMAGGLPVVASRIRGNTELVKDEYLCDVNNADGYAELIKRLYNNAELRNSVSADNIKSSQKYDVSNTVNEMADIYRLFM